VKKNQLEAIALTGKIKGARPRGQQRMTSRLITNCLWWQMDKYIDTEGVTKGTPVDLLSFW